MKNINGMLVLEKKNCTNCQDGKVASKKTCPSCRGTGNGIRGGKGKCKECFGYKYKWDWAKPDVCPTCFGNYINFADETDCDYYDKEIWENLKFKVIRQDREMTVAESLIGLGCIFSVTDYGSAWKGKNVLNYVMEHNKDQVSKIVRNGKFCDYVVIIITPMGYVVKAVWE